MIKATGEDGAERLRELVETVFSSGAIPNDWEESCQYILFKGNREALDRVTDETVMKQREPIMDTKIPLTTIY